ncbi:unnamed protein product, partial [Rotaria magnacalcarata]
EDAVFRFDGVFHS